MPPMNIIIHAKTYLETKHRPIYIVAETNEDCHEDTTV